jgi:Uma2 family endonuclease
MTTPLDKPPAPASQLPIGPTIEAWRAMSAPERERFLLSVIDALSDPRTTMTEGRPHQKAKARALDLLGLHFKAMGRTVYLAAELAVVYPGEQVFTPDVLAVIDVPQPEDDERMAWVVADENRGLDFVLEVLHRGDRNKDLVVNVERYARLGIPEYFVYDRAQQRIHAYQLGVSRRYEKIVPQSGRFPSMVLGVDLAVLGGTIRFFQGTAELFGTTDLVGQLTGMVSSLTDKADAEAARAEEAVASATAALNAMRDVLLATLEARGIPCPDDVRARVTACNDPATLRRWLVAALHAKSAADVFAKG